MPRRQVSADLRVNRVGALVVRGPDEAEANILVQLGVLGQVAAIRIAHPLAVHRRCRVVAEDADHILLLVGHLARPVLLVHAHVKVLAQRRRVARRVLEEVLVVAELVEGLHLVLVATWVTRTPRPDAVLALLAHLVFSLEACEHGALDCMPASTEQLCNGGDQAVLDHVAVDSSSEQRVEHVLVLGVARARGAQLLLQEADEVLDASILERIVLVEDLECTYLRQQRQLAEHLLRVGCAACDREERVGDRLGLLGSVWRRYSCALLLDALLEQLLRLLELVARLEPLRLAEVVLRSLARCCLDRRAAVLSLSLLAGHGCRG